MALILESNLKEMVDRAELRRDGWWVAIYLKTGVEYDEVLNDVVLQLREIWESVKSITKAT